MTKIVFQQEFSLSHYDHQSHIVYRFHVPQGSRLLKILFKYNPLLETNKVSMRRSLDKEGLYEDSEFDQEGFRNLLTLSVNDPKVFRGAHHYFNTQQEIIISNSQASLGFVPGPIEPGMWEVVLSNHGIFSDKVDGHIQVAVEGVFSQVQQSCPFGVTLAQPHLSLKDRTRDIFVALQDYSIELHSHTTHSDASQSTRELLEAASEQELDWLAITDHNTISAVYEAKEIVEDRNGLSVNVLAGIEYTTFYGHFLVHGPLDKIQKNWTGVTLDNVDDYFAELKAQGVNITIAHPYDTGNPYCTGCRFDYPILDYRYIDNIEVWNETNPLQRDKNIQAYSHWINLLKQGVEINASMGRDWHRPTPDDLIPVTHVLAKKDAQDEDILKSLNLGRTYVSLAGELEISVNDIYTIGDRLPNDQVDWQISITLRNLSDDARNLSIFTEQGLLEQIDFVEWNNLKDIEFTKEFLIDMRAFRLLRIEVQNIEGRPLLFSNPIYRAVSDIP